MRFNWPRASRAVLCYRRISRVSLSLPRGGIMHICRPIIGRYCRETRHFEHAVNLTRDQPQTIDYQTTSKHFECFKTNASLQRAVSDIETLRNSSANPFPNTLEHTPSVCDDSRTNDKLLSVPFQKRQRRELFEPKFFLRLIKVRSQAPARKL